MKILIADKLSPTGVDHLRQQEGVEVIEAYGSPPEKVLELAAGVDAIIVRSETRITREVIEAAPHLKAIGRAGVGVDNIDVEAATERGVVVMNAPGGNTIATAELTFTHLLCAARPIVQATASMREGKWDRKAFSGNELCNKTLGILGLGRIGGEVARRALAFGMRVLAYDPYLAPSRAKALQVECVDFEAILRDADFITVHMPLTEGTRNLINASSLAKMKDGVRIINCARGGLIDEKALSAAVESGKVAAAGLDVYEAEPLPADHALRGLPQVVLTPHLGASTKEAQESVGLEIADAVIQAVRGGIIRNAVNMPSVDARTLQVIGPYLELGSRLGTLVQQVSPPQIETLRITYWGKVVELDANSLTRAILRGYLQCISGQDTNFVNAPVIMERLGIQVQVTKSNLESDYTELVRVEAQAPDGSVTSASGTLIGKAQLSRIVEINERDVEASPAGLLLLLENHDEPGIVGMFGTILGRDGVNIAAMSLGRNQAGGTALTAISVDSEPSAAALEELRAHRGIVRAQLVAF
ncbi:MAG: phosphoglycerate dehydrogenase [Puniceicoccaceae bacterium]|nr:MAG: phosphoglycerate dehydrogenase [Puniceicoccaceae bacterium]